MRLVSLDALMERADEVTFMGFQAVERKKHFMDLVSALAESCTTIDAVEVCRCKDCEEGEIVAKMPSGCDHIFCHIHKEWVTPDYFCGSGERKDGEG